MTPLSSFPDSVRQRIRAILFDIDDTITHEGRLPACAYYGMERLHRAGFITIPVTGRPAGWCDHMARMWPVDGVIGENGAFYFRYDELAGKMQRCFWYDEQARRELRERLRRIAEEVLRAVPGARLASDQAYRESDLAIDIREDVSPLSESQVECIQVIFRKHGAIAKTSSIHVNGWFGDYDKRSMALRMLRDEFARDKEQARQDVIYVGDSPNDVPMFEFFRDSVGVANIERFVSQLSSSPRWITRRVGGYGFAEFADMMLTAKQT